MADNLAKIDADRELLREAHQRGGLFKLGTYVRLSGPGWLQSALTLGGGSLASSLYLGVLAGVSMMWLQPFAMILGIVMLSAIGYVAMSTGERPFRAINQHVNPVLGWSWLLASLAANMVWALPQYALSYGVLEQNLLPNLLGSGGALAGDTGKWVVSGVLLTITTAITWSYGSGSWGVRLYEWMLKLLVAMVVACFFGVVIKLNYSSGGIDWSGVFAGFVPEFGQLFNPAAGFAPILERIVDPQAREYWSNLLVAQQRDVMISAAATAVGINMTFLLPYSMLAKGWTREFRGLAIFDLSTGMFIPFTLVTSCVIIASATQFHAQMPNNFAIEGDRVVATPKFEKELGGMLTNREKQVTSPVGLAEQELAATLVQRDAMELAQSLVPLTGPTVANVIFGVGVVGMALSTITLLMLISGFVVCEVLNVPAQGWPHRLGCMLAASGALWPLLWAGQAKFWLAIVTSVFGMVLLPIAYFTFFLLMNQRSLLGNELPRGGRRVLWNVLMTIAAFSSAGAAGYVIWAKTGVYGAGFVGVLLALTLVVQFTRTKPELPHRAA